MSKWNLNSLFESFDSDKFQDSIKTFENDCKELLSFESKFNEDYKNIEEYLKLTTRLLKNVSLVAQFCNLSLAVNNADQDANNYNQKINKLYSSTTQITTKANKWISSFDITEITSKSSYLKEHEFYLSSIKENNKYNLDDATELAISKLTADGPAAFTKQQNSMLSNLTVEFRGETLPINSMTPYLEDKDPKTRKEAYELCTKAYNSIAEPIAFSLNSIKGWVNTDAEIRGYKNALDKTLIDSRMKKETLDSLLEAIKEYLPYFRKYLRHKGKLLGYDNGLPMFEMRAPIGNSVKKFTIDEAESFVLENFKSFSDELHDFAKRAFDEEWVDYDPKKGKRGGAFCANIATIKESRVMHNFNGSFEDVSTLAHELGHGYHGDCIFENSFLNTNYTMPVAETASIFCENIVFQNTLKNSTKEEQVSLLDSELKKFNSVCTNIIALFTFEDRVFKNRESKFMNAEDLTKINHEVLLEVYGDGIDPNFVNSNSWIRIPHYYSASLSYYNFPYAFGALFGSGLYAKFIENPDQFRSTYTKLLKATGMETVEGAASIANIDVTDINFWRASLDEVKVLVEKFIELTS